MEKVWFKLRQTDHYPPPEDTILLGDGDDLEASICLGHYVSGLKNLDFPLNRGSILPFPRLMTVHRNTVLNFSWNDSTTHAPGITLAAGIPVLATAGITVKASLQTAFMQTVENHESYDRLDTYTVQPTASYIENCLDREELKAYVNGRPFWSMFMITGIKVARTGTRETREENALVVDVGPQLDAFGLASLTATTNIKRATSKSASGNYTRDFIWAIRLAKVHKGLLVRDWSVAAYTRRATFDDKEGDADVESALQSEGMDEFQIIDDNDLDEAIVLNEQFIS
ncbi:hypothetical protein FPSE_07446 [Fusarium pseudograminearum CS3096]|uniref:Uncharacterized protein n=1 Tax=Fusarium pseudograminearum (strain CS3096) TaxID=1028729 RepID=K3VE63_FUSPC|nr:hypothetical protein FPSE_07446 [Fusarium pseudograminearum CS3096]EKJ72422.1 hypothetical protein FPSE_07446 [Fusarium pseudograminearum CS3096]KAF0635311.1 hypothetical protein FPSE5266_07446 [Fusarium pseudograminearum]